MVREDKRVLDAVDGRSQGFWALDRSQHLLQMVDGMNPTHTIPHDLTMTYLSSYVMIFIRIYVLVYGLLDEVDMEEVTNVDRNLILYYLASLRTRSIFQVLSKKKPLEGYSFEDLGIGLTTKLFKHAKTLQMQESSA